MNWFLTDVDKAELEERMNGLEERDEYIISLLEKIAYAADRFWNVYQQEGNRRNYQLAFYGEGWTDETYNPKYPIVGSNLRQGFSYAQITDTKVDIDVSECDSQTINLFYVCEQLVTIRKLIVPESLVWTNQFTKCYALENLTIEGTIGQTGLNLGQSTKLTHDSLMSIINHLQDKSSDTSGTVWTVTIGATNKAKLTEDELEIAKNKGWTVN